MILFFLRVCVKAMAQGHWDGHRRSRRMIDPMTAERFVEHGRIERARKGRPRAPRKPRVRSEAQITAAAERSKKAAERKEHIAERKLHVIKNRARSLLKCEDRCKTKHGPRVSRGKRICVGGRTEDKRGRNVCRRWGFAPPGL